MITPQPLKNWHVAQEFANYRKCMSKKKLDLFCFSCDTEFTLRFSPDDIITKCDIIHCPFCGDEIETENDQDDRDEEEDDDR